ncbi:hypothetical protein BBW65_06850 [Helicobacter enhydrae]|uniref:DnaA initiator-associating factor for replication initiation HobA n=2 Tax=Helicobacter enhydrae TaxID=222136 RepID=A0A1B1U6Y7_9HELI|nr:hypothetical protein BBW65_06850 [Helicobacter enhydrae]
MEEISDWILQTIRKENELQGKKYGWLEENYLNLSLLFSNALSFILRGGTFIIVTDNQRLWFKHYMLANINHPKNNRPFLPFVSMEGFENILPIQNSKSSQNVQLFKDMLDMTFKEYAFFYVGKNNLSPIIDLALENENSFLWMIGESISNSLRIDEDDILDVKLLQLYKLFDLSLSAMIVEKFSLEF